MAFRSEFVVVYFVYKLQKLKSTLLFLNCYMHQLVSVTSIHLKLKNTKYFSHCKSCLPSTTKKFKSRKQRAKIIYYITSKFSHKAGKITRQNQEKFVVYENLKQEKFG